MLAARNGLAHDLDDDRLPFGRWARAVAQYKFLAARLGDGRFALAQKFCLQHRSRRDDAVEQDAGRDDLAASDLHCSALADAALDQPVRGEDSRHSSASAWSRPSAGLRRWNSFPGSVGL